MEKISHLNLRREIFSHYMMFTVTSSVKGTPCKLVTAKENIFTTAISFIFDQFAKEGWSEIIKSGLKEVSGHPFREQYIIVAKCT